MLDEAGLRAWAASAGVLIAAAVLSAALIIWLRPWLIRYALARPNARSSHREPTPQGGGVAVIAATILVTLGALAWRADAGTREVSTILLAAAFVAVVGGIDDVRPLPVVPRFLMQMLAVVAAIAVLPGDMRVVPFIPWWAERICLLIVLLWFLNLANFMDGIDWMTVAEMVPLTASLALLAAFTNMPPAVTVLSLALLGAMLGFAPFNRPVAKLFIGDVGSLPIGLLVGWMLLWLAEAGEVAAALLLPLYYLSDASITLMRRVLAGEPFWQAHRSHFYQRAGDMGFTVPEIVGRVFLTNVALGCLAFLSVAWHGAAAIATALLIGAALVGWLLLSFTRKRR